MGDPGESKAASESSYFLLPFALSGSYSLYLSSGHLLSSLLPEGHSHVPLIIRTDLEQLLRCLCVSVL